MKLKELIAKALKAEALSDEEKSALEALDPDALAADLKKAQKAQSDAEAKLKTETAARIAAEKVVENAKKAGMSDLEKAQAELAAANTAREAAEKAGAEAQKELAALKRSARISELAGKHGFEDKAYLDYLLARDNVDVDNSNAVATYLGNAKKTMPKHFKSDLASGAIPPKPPAAKTEEPPRVGDKISSIVEALKNAPEAQNIFE